MATARANLGLGQATRTAAGRAALCPDVVCDIGCGFGSPDRIVYGNFPGPLGFLIEEFSVVCPGPLTTDTYYVFRIDDGDEENLGASPFIGEQGGICSFGTPIRTVIFNESRCPQDGGGQVEHPITWQPILIQYVNDGLVLGSIAMKFERISLWEKTCGSGFPGLISERYRHVPLDWSGIFPPCQGSASLYGAAVDQFRTLQWPVTVNITGVINHITDLCSNFVSTRTEQMPVHGLTGWPRYLTLEAVNVVPPAPNQGCNVNTIYLPLLRTLARLPSFGNQELNFRYGLSVGGEQSGCVWTHTVTTSPCDGSRQLTVIALRSVFSGVTRWRAGIYQEARPRQSSSASITPLWKGEVVCGTSGCFDFSGGPLILTPLAGFSGTAKLDASIFAA